jgi:hypothetical protein
MSVISQLLTNTTEGRCLEVFTEGVMDDAEGQNVLETFASAGRRGEKDCGTKGAERTLYLYRSSLASTPSTPWTPWTT